MTCPPCTHDCEQGKTCPAKNKNEIIAMARQADGQVTTWVNHSTIQKTTTFTFESPLDYSVSGEYPEKYHIKFLEAFAKLVAAKEREACAEICDDQASGAYWEGADACASRIRKRGQA
jgi:hypothetical protein